MERLQARILSRLPHPAFRQAIGPAQREFAAKIAAEVEEAA